jgi:aryl-alcohol dehydrogenase-like predicted oxidoreductase
MGGDICFAEMLNRTRKINNSLSMLVLGTAQLGMPYGIANRTGQPDLETAIAIIRTAWEQGIHEFDTAQVYGISETILGKALSTLGIAKEARIITKLAPKLNPNNVTELQQALEDSMERLQIQSLHGLMLHREEWMNCLNDGLYSILQQIREKGTTHHLGVSLYSPLKAIQVLELELFDMIQIPANVFDRRFEEAGVFQLADKREKQVYIRSIFLQGLLLLSPEELSPQMAFSEPVLRQFDHLCKEHALTRHKASLLYIKAKYPKAKVVIGAETQTQIEQNIAEWNDNIPEGLVQEISQTFLNIDETIIDPNRWPSQ